MFDCLDSAATFPNETYRCREYSFAPLPGLNRSCQEAPAITHTFHEVQNGNRRVPGKDKVAMHAMRMKDRVVVCR